MVPCLVPGGVADDFSMMKNADKKRPLHIFIRLSRHGAGGASRLQWRGGGTPVTETLPNGRVSDLPLMGGCTLEPESLQSNTNSSGAVN